MSIVGAEPLDVMLAPIFGRREHVKDVMDVLGDVRGRAVRVGCRELLSANQNVPERLIQAIVLDGGATAVEFELAPRDFVEEVHAAAARLGVADRVSAPYVQSKRFTGGSAFAPRWL